MPVSAKTLELLMEAGLAGDDLLRIVASIDRDNEKKTSSRAERQARYRARKRAESGNSDVTSDVTETVTKPSLPRARVDITQQTKNKPNGKNNSSSTVTVTPRDELSRVLDADDAEAVIEHRKRIKKPLSARSAKLLANSLSRCPDVKAAADEMIERGWASVKPEWLDNSNRGPPDRVSRMQQAIEETRADVGITSGDLI